LPEIVLSIAWRAKIAHHILRRNKCCSFVDTLQRQVLYTRHARHCDGC